MRFHFFRPLHGWREFVHEIVIVVLGVLLALAGAEMVEAWRWQWQVGSTRQSIANELAANANQAAERLSVEDCLRDRVGELAAKLRATNGRWAGDPLPLGAGAALTPHWDNRAMGRVYSVPLRGWSHDAWDTAKSTGAADHMSHEELASYGAVYAEVAGLDGLRDQELLLESRLAFLSTDQQLDNSTRADALSTLGQLDALNAVTAGLSSLIVDQMRDLHLHVDKAAMSQALRQSIKGEQQYRGACVKDVQVPY